MLADAAPELLEGAVSADETIVGGKNKNRHADKKVPNSQGRANVDKTAVVGKMQRVGMVKTFVVADTSAVTLQTLMVGNVARQAVVITDAYSHLHHLEGLKNISTNNNPKAATVPKATSIQTTSKGFGAS